MLVVNFYVSSALVNSMDGVVRLNMVRGNSRLNLSIRLFSILLFKMNDGLYFFGRSFVIGCCGGNSLNSTSGRSVLNLLLSLYLSGNSHTLNPILNNFLLALTK